MLLRGSCSLSSGYFKTADIYFKAVNVEVSAVELSPGVTVHMKYCDNSHIEGRAILKWHFSVLKIKIFGI